MSGRKPSKRRLDFLADHEGAAVLAGGQSLDHHAEHAPGQPGVCFVDINRIEQLSHLVRDGDEVVVGALVRHAEVAASPLILDHIPLVAKAMEQVAHPADSQSRHLLRQSRLCGSGCGDAAFAAALNARLILANRSERRTVAARDYFLGVYETARRQDELLIEVRFPIARPQEYFGFAELTRRHGDFASSARQSAHNARGADRALDIVVFAAVANLVVSKAATRDPSVASGPMSSWTRWRAA